MILFSKLYEHQYNNALSRDYVELHLNELGFYLDHKKRYFGWRGEINENFTIDLDLNNIQYSQTKIDSYLKENYLNDEMKIDLKDYNDLKPLKIK